MPHIKEAEYDKDKRTELVLKGAIHFYEEATNTLKETMKHMELIKSEMKASLLQIEEKYIEESTEYEKQKELEELEELEQTSSHMSVDTTTPLDQYPAQVPPEEMVTAYQQEQVVNDWSSGRLAAVYQQPTKSVEKVEPDTKQTSSVEITTPLSQYRCFSNAGIKRPESSVPLRWNPFLGVWFHWYSPHSCDFKCYPCKSASCHMGPYKCCYIHQEDTNPNKRAHYQRMSDRCGGDNRFFKDEVEYNIHREDVMNKIQNGWNWRQNWLRLLKEDVS
jgi:hypothetical protein